MNTTTTAPDFDTTYEETQLRLRNLGAVVRTLAGALGDRPPTSREDADRTATWSWAGEELAELDELLNQLHDLHQQADRPD